MRRTPRSVTDTVIAALAGLTLIVTLSLVLAGCAGGQTRPPPSTVASFDLDRYLGRWHEVARVPNTFQDTCAGDVTADYSRQPDGLIGVVNACRNTDGAIERAEGVARPAADGAGGKLQVTFVSALGSPIWLASGDYWVIGLDRDYRWSVVGSPARDYGWILAREPTLPPPILAYLTRLIAEKGYEPCRFVLSETARAAAPRTLCDATS
jgi:apolipoprotein D and lipocalin family protein